MGKELQPKELNKLTAKTIKLGIRAQEISAREAEKRKPTELQIVDGKFVDMEGKKVRVEVLGVGLIQVGFETIKELRTVHQDVKIPEGTNAFVKGRVFDNNSGGSWRAFPDYVAPAIFLKKL